MKQAGERRDLHLGLLTPSPEVAARFAASIEAIFLQNHRLIAHRAPSIDETCAMHERQPLQVLFLDERAIALESVEKRQQLQILFAGVPQILLVPSLTRGASLSGSQDFLALHQLNPQLLGSLLSGIVQRLSLEDAMAREIKRISFEQKAIHDLIEKNADGLLVLGRDGAIRFANPAAQVLFALSNEECSDLPFGLPARPEELMELELMTKVGIKVVELRFVPIIWDGEPCQLASLRDITHHKKMQEEMLEAKLAAERALSHKSDFLARMSHEIRTPLNGVLGMTTLLMDEPMSTKARSFIQTIKASGDILLTVINDILDFSKVDAGRLKLEHIEYDFCLAIEETLQVFSSGTADKRLLVASAIDCRFPRTLVGDPARFRQILSNLISNAIKFTEHGHVFVRATVQDQYLRIAVEDTGIGIDPEGQKQLFQPFQQADTSITRVYGGTGLGLAISRKLAELMGGAIHLRSEPGHGSCFWLDLPLPENPQDAPAKQDLPARQRVGLRTEYAPLRSIIREQLEGSEFELVDDETFDLGIRDTKDHNGLSGIPILQLCFRGDGYPEGIAQRLELGVLTQTLLLSGLRSLRAVDVVPDKTDWDVILPSGASPMNRLRILVADDNSVNQRVALHMLANLGYEADLANNGHEVLQALLDTSYDLIFMDCEMPICDGFTATRRIRESVHDWSQIPIIAMTAYALAGDRERCFSAGMNDYIAKPLDLLELKTLMEKWSSQIQQTPVHQPVIDEERVQLIDDPDDPQFLRELFDAYDRNYQNLLLAIKDAVENLDYEGLARAAHTLKGSSGNIGANSIASMAMTLEMMAKTRKIKRPTDIVQKIEHDFRQVQAYYHNYPVL